MDFFNSTKLICAFFLARFSHPDEFVTPGRKKRLIFCHSCLGKKKTMALKIVWSTSVLIFMDINNGKSGKQWEKTHFSSFTNSGHPPAPSLFVKQAYRGLSSWHTSTNLPSNSSLSDWFSHRGVEPWWVKRGSSATVRCSTARDSNRRNIDQGASKWGAHASLFRNLGMHRISVIISPHCEESVLESIVAFSFQYISF